MFAEQVKKVEAEVEQAMREQAEAVAADASEVPPGDGKEDDTAMAEELTVPNITMIPSSASQSRRDVTDDGEEDEEGEQYGNYIRHLFLRVKYFKYNQSDFFTHYFMSLLN